MNYLAHIFLSPENELVTVGNFMADHVKGNKYKLYTPDLQKGILLHRQIDSFTDAHELVRKSKRRLDNRYGLYRGIIIDILYDHILAKNWSSYSDVPLDLYTQSFYEKLNRHYDILPEKIQYMSKYLIREDWLLSYAKTEGIQKVLEGMNRRTGGKSDMNLAINDLMDHYGDFESDFTSFFKDLVDFSSNKIIEINKLYD
jgi:acyl carrier protein phosphodiesterase